MVAWMLVLAFILRLGLGVGLSQALPVFGYDEEVPNAGYIFYDAYHRDRQAWQLAQSGDPCGQPLERPIPWTSMVD